MFESVTGNAPRTTQHASIPAGGGGALALIASLLLSVGAFAQQAEEAEPEGDIEEIIVTGSRIPRVDLEASAPITVFTRADIDRSGATSIGQLLRELPSVAGQAQTTQINNGGGGTQNVSLRGLGSVRTLVLLNGRRLPPNVDEGADGIAVDLNTIPVSIIDRVEVLKDGASAVYGSDAIAGVVNVITRRGFEGVELSGYYGDSDQGGGRKEELSVVTGGKTDKSSWVFVAQYTDEEEIAVPDRSWAREPLAAFQGNIISLGSSAPPWGRYRPTAEVTAVMRGDSVLDLEIVDGDDPGPLVTLQPGDVRGVDEWCRVDLADADEDNMVDGEWFVCDANGDGDGDLADGTVYLRDAAGDPIQAMNDDGDLLFQMVTQDDGTMVPLLDQNGDQIPVYQTHGREDLTRGPEFSEQWRNFNFFGGDSYNFAPSNHQRQPNKRWNMSLFGDTQLETISNLGPLGETTLYVEASYTSRESAGLLAEVPLAPFAFFGHEATYSADNFYNPFGVDIIDWRRRMVEGGSRNNIHDEETIRLLVGLRGDFTGAFEGWRWDISLLKAESERTVNFGHVYNLNRVANAVGPTTGSPADGDLMCANDPDNCVPLNVFSQGSVTQEMLNYLTFTTNESFSADQNIWEINFSNASIFELPAGPVGVAFGYQYRDEFAADTPDSQVATLGDASTGTPRQPTSGGFKVDSFYFETVIPLLADQPFVQDLEFEAAVRYSDYNTFGSTTNPKFGLKWRPISELLVRATFSDAFRAPNVGESFGGAGTSFPSLTDPCSAGPSACMDPRVTAPFEPISTQIRERQGGNSDLQPEEADILTIGFVYTPEWMQGLSLAVDYYDIELEQSIQGLGADFILRSCAERGAFCDRIDRFDDGNVRIVDNRTANVGGTESSGFDVLLGYEGLSAPYIGGVFDMRVDATYVDKHNVIQADGTAIEHAGWFRDEQDGHFGEWRVTFGVDYALEDFRISWDSRFIDDVDEEYTDQGTGATLQRTLSGRIYHDIQAAYVFDALNTPVVLTLGIDNLFDRDPPLSLDGFNDNTDVRTFDTIGRYFYLRFRANF